MLNYSAYKKGMGKRSTWCINISEVRICNMLYNNSSEFLPEMKTHSYQPTLSARIHKRKGD